MYYDRSEIRAWNSARALRNRIASLNSSYHGGVRLLAHSMGNVVAGEALKLSSSVIVHSYIAAQAALPVHCYDNTITNSWHRFQTPNVYGHYFSGTAPDVPYFSGNSSKAGSIFRYYNKDDWALKWWGRNNKMKPDFNYHYKDKDNDIDTYNLGAGDRFYYDSVRLHDEHDLVFPIQRYVIFARCAESRSLALGAEPTAVAGFASERDLSILGYDEKHYSHSREFRSNIIDEWLFWNNVFNDFNLN